MLIEREERFLVEVPLEKKRGFCLALDAVFDTTIMVDKAGCIVFANKRVKNLLGYEPDELLGESIEILVPEKSRKRHVSYRNLYLESPKNKIMAERLLKVLRKDGQTIPVLIGLTPFEDRVLAVLMDASENSTLGEELSLQIEKLQKIQERNAAILNALPDLMFRARRDGTVIDFHANDPKLLFAPPETFLQRKVHEFMPPAFVEPCMEKLAETLDSKEVHNFRYSLDILGKEAFFEARLAVSGEDEVLVIVRDETQSVVAEQERESLQSQLLRTQKLESLGILAGGIAHDFNNLLTGIMGNASLALMGMSETNPAYSSIQHIIDASSRAAGLTRQILTYAGKAPLTRELIDLSTLAKELSRLLETSISSRVQLRLELDETLPAFSADATQIQQLLMNLVINGAEAIDDNGTILVSTGRMHIDEDYALELFFPDHLPVGDYVFMEVHDTGRGMTPEQKEQIFDPFFSTKAMGRGLGLAAVLGIVQSHNGGIRVYSSLGKGTTFKVFFPVAEGEVSSAASAASVNLQGSGKILVVDDEPVVRDFVLRTLQRFGYEVLMATNGQEGVDLFRKHHEELALVLLDMTMPVMGGEEAFREMRKSVPGVKAILMSGFNESEATRKFNTKGLTGFLQKPFPPEALGRLLKASLSKKS